MATSRLSQATYVTKGYGQVEANHLSAQYTGRIHAQWPAASTINVLENGQFVKYNPATGLVGFTGSGEWMLVYNEVKVYHDGEGDQDFAMLKSNYAANVYSPVGPFTGTPAQGTSYNGVIIPAPYRPDGVSDISAPAQFDKPLLMPTGTNMVPRLFMTEIGDIMTTNTIKLAQGTTALSVGDTLVIGTTDGILTDEDDADVLAAAEQIWTVSKVYTMPDGQPGVKVIRTK